MGTNTRKKIGARAGGLVSALAIAGLIGVGGASAADAATEQRPSTPAYESPTPTENNPYVNCAVIASPSLIGGPKWYAAATGTCILDHEIN